MWQDQGPGLAIPVSSSVSEASGSCEGEGVVEDYLGKSTEKEGSPEKKTDLYLHLYVRCGAVRKH